jgi:hypothetical protein
MPLDTMTPCGIGGFVKKVAYLAIGIIVSRGIHLLARTQIFQIEEKAGKLVIVWKRIEASILNHG